MIRKERVNLSQQSLQLITVIINTFFFGFGVAMFVIGVLYLTSYFYEYTFSKFNPTVVAAIFVPFGTVIAFLALISIICVLIVFCRTKQTSYLDDSARKSNKLSFIMGIVVAFCSVFILILFIVLLAIGIWGLVVYSNGQSLRNEVSNNFYNAGQNYMVNGDNDATKGIDWVQNKVYFCFFKILSSFKPEFIYWKMQYIKGIINIFSLAIIYIQYHKKAIFF